MIIVYTLEYYETVKTFCKNREHHYYNLSTDKNGMINDFKINNTLNR